MNASDASSPHAGPVPRLLLTAVLVAGLVIGGAAVWYLRAPTTSSAPPSDEHAADAPRGVVELSEEAQRTASIEIATATTAQMAGALEVTGIVAPDDSKVAHVRPLARGVVDQISVSLGSRVRSGQPLLTYDNIELGQLVGDYVSEQASLRQAQTDRDVKQSSLARAESLIEIEAIARQELDVRRAEFRNAEAGVASARARVARIEEQLHRFGLSDADLVGLAPAAGAAPHRAASHSTLRAPFDGVVTKFDVAAGEVVEPDKEVFTVADISTVWVLADVYEKDLAKVPSEGNVSITVDAYPDRTFVGRIAHVSDLIDPATRTAKVRCVVENREGLLKLDMFAKVRLSLSESSLSVVVPVDAIQQLDGQEAVFIQSAPTRFERRDVQTGRRTGGNVEVLSGVDAGARVVGKGSFYLKTALLRERIGDEH